MKYRCDAIQDAIWEHVRFGEDLADADRAHVADCAECARAMEEARKLAGLVQSAASVPTAPDCTDTVMDRLSERAKRPVWAYAVAAVLLILVIAAGMTQFRPHGAQAPQVVQERREAAPVPEVKQPERNAPTPTPKPEVAAPAVASERTETVVKRPVRRHPRKNMRIEAPAPVPDLPVRSDEPPAPEQVAQERRPIAAVSVTWGEQPANTGSYAYTVSDEATGETTTCRVEKSPGAVTIYMKSTPSGEQPPSEGV